MTLYGMLPLLTAAPTEDTTGNFIEHFWTVVPETAATVLGLAVLVIPVVMLILGLIGLICPPKEPNWLIGYRTRRAMGTEESWFFAQKLRGILWSVLGLIMLIPSIVVRGLMKSGSLDFMCRMVITYCLVQAGILLLTILAMRIVMLVRYDRQGQRRVRVEQ